MPYCCYIQAKSIKMPSFLEFNRKDQTSKQLVRSVAVTLFELVNDPFRTDQRNGEIYV